MFWFFLHFIDSDEFHAEQKIIKVHAFFLVIKINYICIIIITAPANNKRKRKQ